MDSKDTTIKINGQEQLKLITNSDNQIKNIKSNFILKKLLDYLHKRKSLEIIK